MHCSQQPDYNSIEYINEEPQTKLIDGSVRSGVQETIKITIILIKVSVGKYTNKTLFRCQF